MRRAILLVVVLAAGAFGAAAWGSTGAAKIRLAYVGSSPIPGGVYRLDPGKKPVRLSSSRTDQFPAWSPDRKSIAFVHQIKQLSPNTNCQIVVVTGTKAKAIPGLTAACRAISWGRNSLIAFDDPKNAVWVVKPDGSGRRKLVSASDGSTLNPAWSPDDKSVAFGNGVSGGITVAGANGRGLHQITKVPFTSADGYPAWSPNGKEIAFVRTNTEDPGSVYVMVARADGSGAKRIAKTMADPAQVRPAWTPDGSAIVYGGTTDGLEIVTATGGASTTIAPGFLLAQPAVAPK